MSALWLVTLLVLLITLAVWRRRRLPADGRIVFVIGADSGFGFSCCHYLHAAGCRVVAGCLDPGSDGAALLRNLGCRVLPVDVTSDASLAAAARQLAELAGPDGVWAVVCNAGVLVLGRLTWLTWHQVERMFQVNILGMVRSVRAMLPVLTPGGGRLILVNSPCSQVPSRLVAAYSATKAAVRALGASLRLDLQHLGVTTILLTPGDMAGSTNILATQADDLQAMWEQMDEDTRKTDRESFSEFHSRFVGLTARTPTVLDIPRLRRAVLRAVLDVRPLRHYTAVETGTLLWFLLSPLMPTWLYERLLMSEVHYKLHCLDTGRLDFNNLI